MRKIDFVLTAAAAMMLAGCANDENVITQGGGASELTDATIGFNLTVPGQTRATLSGKDAADKLNSEFVVFGIKNAVDETAAQNTFTNYKVVFTNNSAGSTETNTNNWEYVGQDPYASTLVSPAVNTKQTVKYWDYSAKNGYTFTAFAGKTFLEGANAKVEKITNATSDYENGYKVTVPSAAELDKIFFADRKKVEKGDFNKPVALTFRNFGAKVRVGFYETVPGYSVKIDRFYYDNTATSAPVTTFGTMKTASTDNFVAALQNVKSDAQNGNTVKVTYYGANTANENQPKVDCSSSSTYQYTLTLGSGIVGQTLGTTSTGATWDKANKEYTMVYPNLEATTPMLIRCDYTLTADDKSGETIKVKNARVTVPVQYCQWKSNYAYTYLFKISDNTNGTTGDDPQNPDLPGDNEGLHPITFDAVVVESTDYAQETTTTVSTNSVTSYAKDGYNAKKDIYFVNTTQQTSNQQTSDQQSSESKVTGYKVLAPTAIGDDDTKAQVYSVSWNSGSASIVEGDVLAQLTGVKNGLTMTAVTTGAASLVEDVPSADGTNLNFGERGALKFTPSAEGTYAYVYCTTKYAAPTYDDATGFTEETTYYAKTTNDVYYVASGITDVASYNNYLATEGRKLYTQQSSGTAGVYDIKVITVK